VQRWLWVTQPDFWAQLQGGRLEHGLKIEWTCDKKARHGDVALLYRADMAKDIAHLFRVDSDKPVEGEHPLDANRKAWWCHATLMHTLRHPLLLPDLRAEPRLASWAALEANFHALSFEIDDTVWRVLLEFAHPLDRIDLRRYGS